MYLKKQDKRGQKVLVQSCKNIFTYGVEFHHPAFVKHQDSIEIHDGVQTMRDHHGRDSFERIPNHRLNQTVRVTVNAGGGFVQHQHCGESAEKSVKT